MNKELYALYKDARAPMLPESQPGKVFVYSAKTALRIARGTIEANAIQAEFERLGGSIIHGDDASDDDADSGALRILECTDWNTSADDLEGDCFNPSANPNINPNILKRQQGEHRARVAVDGVYGYRAQYHDGTEWHDVDSIWGIIGGDFERSGYDADLMSAAIKALADHRQREARAYEATRPDMYELCA